MSLNSQRSKLRRVPDSPVSVHQSGSESGKRTSVFERLGSRPLSSSKIASSSSYERKEVGDSRKVVTSKRSSLEPEETDLRHKVRKNKPISPPPPSTRRAPSPPPPPPPPPPARRPPSPPSARRASSPPPSVRRAPSPISARRPPSPPSRRGPSPLSSRRAPSPSARRAPSPPSPRYDHKRYANRSLSPTPVQKDETRIKSLISLVSAPTSRGSPTASRHRSEISAHYKRGPGDPKHPSKYEDCDDEEELEKKRQQLQKELELEIEREKRELQKGGVRNVGSITGTCSTSESRSLCSSAASSASGSYTSTDASYSKSGSSCSRSSDEHHNKNKQRSRSRTSGSSPVRVSRRSPHLSSLSKSTSRHRSRSPRTPPRSLSSSSQQRRPRPISPAHDLPKHGEVKLDRHGNVRISLREKERQRRLEREQAMQRSRSPTRSDRKDILVDTQKMSRSDPKKRPSSLSGSRSESHKTSSASNGHSRPRSPRRSRESTPERRRLDERRRYDERDYDRDRRYDHYRDGKDVLKRDIPRSSDSKLYRRDDREPIQPKTPPYVKTSVKPDEDSRSRSRRIHGDPKVLERDRSMPSPVMRSYSRSPPPSNHSYDSKRERHHKVDTGKDRLMSWDPKKSPPYSRESSPNRSIPSKRSRTSSVGSCSSRPSLSKGRILRHTRGSVVSSDLTSTIDPVVHTTPNDQKAEPTSSTSKPIGEVPDANVNTALHSTGDMSPISNNSSFGDLDEVSPEAKTENTSEMKEPYVEQQHEAKKSEGFVSEENYSDWSDGDDELLLQTGNHEDFETVDEVGSLSSRTQDKEIGGLRELEDTSRHSVVDTTVIDSQDGFSNGQDDALEAISDDELDAIIGESDPLDACNESQQSGSGQQMLDALEIDWSSLTSKPPTQVASSGAARKRFLPANILSSIGFSQALAGPELTEKIINYCKQEQKENFVPFRHPVAALHCRINEQLEQRNNIFGKTGSNTTALNAKKDLQLRRFLGKAIPFSSQDLAHKERGISS